MTRRRSSSRRSGGHGAPAPRPPRPPPPPVDPLAGLSPELRELYLSKKEAEKLAAAGGPIPLELLILTLPGYDPRVQRGDCVFDVVAAARVIEFFEMCLTHIEGEWSGQAFKLQPWQQAVVANLFGWKRPDGFRRYREMFLEVPRKNGKALDVDTKIPTPAGWTKMGDLRAGDRVFADDGSQCTVLEAHEEMRGRECFRLEFSDGSSVVADAEHLWTLEDLSRGKFVTVTTREAIAQGLDVARGKRYRLPDAGALELPEAVVEIPPYLLGLWLGDGDSDCGRISASAADADEYCRADPGLSRGAADRRNDVQRLRAHGLRSALRRAGLLGAKRIPREYQRASAAQRWDLLRGLMDSDGYVSKAGQCELTLCDEVLAGDALELVRSLGLKATMRSSPAKLRGREVGTRHRIQFWTERRNSCFRLPRKTDRLKAAVTRGRRRFLVSIEPVETRPVRCIRVDSPSRLFLAGPGLVPTHNTPLCAGIVLYLLVADHEPGAQIYSAAGDKGQAALLFRHAAGMVEADAALSARIVPYYSGKSLEYRASGGFYRALSKEAKTKHGFNSHGVVVDELHVQPNSFLLDALTSSTGTRRQPVVILVTTRDYVRPSICNEKEGYAEKVAANQIVDPEFLPVIYRAPKDAPWDEEATWRLANPNYGISVKPDELAREARKARLNPRARNEFIRLRLCGATQAEVAWIPSELWSACADPLIVGGDVERWIRELGLEGMKCYGAIDLGAVKDLSAFVLYFPECGALLPWFWAPKATAEKREQTEGVSYTAWASEGYITLVPGKKVDFGYVRNAVNDAALRFNIQTIAFDRWAASQLMAELEGEGIDVLGFGQGYKDMTPACRRFEELWLEEDPALRLKHGGHPVLGWNAANVMVETDPAGNLKPSKKKSTERIDGIVASVMAVGSSMVAEPNAYGDGKGFRSL